jgi:hypothetical protein
MADLGTPAEPLGEGYDVTLLSRLKNTFEKNNEHEQKPEYNFLTKLN